MTRNHIASGNDNHNHLFTETKLTEEVEVVSSKLTSVLVEFCHGCSFLGRYKRHIRSLQQNHRCHEEERRGMKGDMMQNNRVKEREIRKEMKKKEIYFNPAQDNALDSSLSLKVNVKICKKYKK